MALLQAEVLGILVKLAGVVGLILAVWTFWRQQLRPFSLLALPSATMYLKTIPLQRMTRNSPDGAAEKPIQTYLVTTISLTNRGSRGGIVHLLALRITLENTQKPPWIFFARNILKPPDEKHPSLVEPIGDAAANFAPLYLPGGNSDQLLLSFLYPYTSAEERFRGQAGSYLTELLCSTDAKNWEVTKSFRFNLDAKDEDQVEKFGDITIRVAEYRELRRRLLMTDEPSDIVE